MTLQWILLIIHLLIRNTCLLRTNLLFSNYLYGVEWQPAYHNYLSIFVIPSYNVYYIQEANPSLLACYDDALATIRDLNLLMDLLSSGGLLLSWTTRWSSPKASRESKSVAQRASSLVQRDFSRRSNQYRCFASYKVYQRQVQASRYRDSRFCSRTTQPEETQSLARVRSGSLGVSTTVSTC